MKQEKERVLGILRPHYALQLPQSDLLKPSVKKDERGQSGIEAYNAYDFLKFASAKQKTIFRKDMIQICLAGESCLEAEAEDN